MTIVEIGVFSEIAASIAVVITLIFLIVQMVCLRKTGP